MNNITSLIMKNMIIKDCTAGYDILTETHIAILITQCSFVQLCYIQTNYTNTTSIKGINTFGDLTLVNVTCDSIMLCFVKNSKRYGIVLSKSKECYTNITLQLTNLHVNTSNNSFYKPILYFSTLTLNHDKVFITNSYFQGATLREELTLPFYIYTYPYTKVYFNNCSLQYPLYAAGIIAIRNGLYMEIDRCNFSGRETLTYYPLINSENCSYVTIRNSKFYSNTMRLLEVQQPRYHNNMQVTIQNTTFSDNRPYLQSLICIKNTTLSLKGPIAFSRNIGKLKYVNNIITNTNDYTPIFELYNSKISANGYVHRVL